MCTVTTVTDIQTFKGTLGEDAFQFHRDTSIWQIKKKYLIRTKNTALNNSLLYKVMLASQYLFADTIKSFRV